MNHSRFQKEKALNHGVDFVFLNGTVITVDAQGRVCQGIAVGGNKILAAGTSAEMKALAGRRPKSST